MVRGRERVRGAVREKESTHPEAATHPPTHAPMIAHIWTMTTPLLMHPSMHNLRSAKWSKKAKR